MLPSSLLDIVTHLGYCFIIMKKPAILFSALAAISLAFLAGCEDEPIAGHAVEINPSYARVRLNQSVTLTASGGWNYRWTLDNRDAGTLSATTGRSVVYTARKEGVTQHVTVTGNGSSSTSSGSSGTNDVASSSEIFSATATIEHVGTTNNGSGEVEK